MSFSKKCATFFFRKVSVNDKKWRSFHQENEGNTGTLEDFLDLTTGINKYLWGHVQDQRSKSKCFQYEVMWLIYVIHHCINSRYEMFYLDQRHRPKWQLFQMVVCTYQKYFCKTIRKLFSSNICHRIDGNNIFILSCDRFYYEARQCWGDSCFTINFPKICRNP